MKYITLDLFSILVFQIHNDVTTISMTDQFKQINWVCSRKKE